MPDTASTGIPVADAIIAHAAQAGLRIGVDEHLHPPMLFSDGTVMLPASTSYTVTIRLPSHPQPSADASLTLIWIRPDGKRGRFESGWIYHLHKRSQEEVTTLRSARRNLRILIVHRTRAALEDPQ